MKPNNPQGVRSYASKKYLPLKASLQQYDAKFFKQTKNTTRRILMGQVVGGLWDTVQGKGYVKRTCEKVFDELADKGKLPLSKLHLATLMVYSAVNKQYLSPYKEPPTIKMVEDKIKDHVAESSKANIVTIAKTDVTVEAKKDAAYEPPATISKEEFCDIILEWLKKDLRIVLANKVLLALMGAPALSIMTKSAAKRVPRINHVVEKVPTPVLIPAYAAAIVLLQDVRLE